MMTEAQHDHYIGLWGAARKAMRAAGVPPKEADARRKQIHAEEGAVYRSGPKAGQPKSSKDLDNSEFSKIKGRFLALSHPADLDKQMDQMDQGAKWLRHCAEAQGYLDQIGLDKNDIAREEYVDGLCRNITGKGLIDLTDGRRRDVLAALKRTARYRDPAKQWPGHDVGRGFVPSSTIRPVSSRRSRAAAAAILAEPDDDHDAAEPAAAYQAPKDGDTPF